MALNKYSAFNYGHTITNKNRNMNFSEDAGVTELTAKLRIGAYTLGQFPGVIATALNAAGDNSYVVTLDRTTRKLTISTEGAELFDLLVDTGSLSASSAFSLAGFEGADIVNVSSIEGSNASGSQYITQTPLLDYTKFQHSKEQGDATIIETPDVVEVISYSTIYKMECSLPAITNFIPQRFIRESATGVEEAVAFMDYAITKQPMEFLESSESGQEEFFTPCILDRTSTNSKGVGYKLRERVAKGLPFYYELKGIGFRQIEVIV